MIVVYVVIAVLVVIGLAVIVSHNRFARQRNLVEESWRQVDVELARRHDLIPNLVETVKGYAAHERQVFEEVTKARNLAAAPGSTPAAQAQQENVLTAVLGRLFAVAENYPDLEASANFGQLQDELSETEDRIAAARRFYNGNVRAFNTRIEAFPSSIVAARMHLTKAEYFETDDASRARPDVSFDASAPAPPPPPPPPS
ncbi:MAG TPA: LemA family protein [Acidimicrobiales bacterium]|jgi:LemA protein|nr:LemA family protein [Acidimicrobiales bacterium]